MRSKTSFFNRGIARNLLRRTWPLWAVYGALLLLLTVGQILGGGVAFDEGRTLQQLTSLTGDILPFLMAPLTAMCLFNFLYNARGTGMMASLPLRREELFCTVYLTGLMPQLGTVLLAALLSALALARAPGQAVYVLPWLGLTVLGTLTYYGIAVFCAMLTGNILILPVIYGLLNLAAVVLEACGEFLMGIFVYGFTGTESVLTWLSPPFELYMSLESYAYQGAAAPRAGLWGLMAAYAAVGLLLSGLALLLFRRRQMERAGDTAAYPVLKPLFRFCMALGTGVVLPALLVEFLFPSVQFWRGSSNAAIIGALAALGAAVGFFAAEMLIQRSLRVFRGRWKGCLALSLAMLALTACLELDLFGIEKRVPAAEDVERVTVSGVDLSGELEKVLSLHRQIIGDKAQNEASGTVKDLRLTYQLKNGSILQRIYGLDFSDQALADPASDAWTAQSLLNTPAAFEARLDLEDREVPLSRDSLSYVCLTSSYTDTKEELYLTGDEAWDFVQNCLLPDVRDGKAGRVWFVLDDEYYDKATIWRARVRWSGKGLLPTGESYELNPTMDIALQMDSERCLDWIGENTQLQIQPLRVTNPELVEYGPNAYDLFLPYNMYSGKY